MTIRRFLKQIITLFYSRILYARKRCVISSSVALSRKTFFSGRNVVHSHVNVINSVIGYGTYVGAQSYLPDTLIGAYCSIAENVRVLSSTHPTKTFVSTHPAFFSTLKQAGFSYTDTQLFEEQLYFDSERQIRVNIGNDVWIGANVLLMGSIEIGDGAIIAAGAIVTKDVKPFEIVAGVPAKHVRYRFSDEQIAVLKEVKWWNRSPLWLGQNVGLFKNINSFCTEMQGRNEYS